MLAESMHETLEVQPSAEALDLRTRISLTRLIHAMEHFRTLAPDLPLQTAHVLLVIAAQPGITTKELMRRVKISQSSCSRNIARLSHTDRHGEQGLGLVRAQNDPADSRRHVMYLTPKGEEFIAVLADILR